MVDVVADDVVKHFRLADLRRRHDHDMRDAGIVHRVHDTALIFGARGVPLAGLGTSFRRQSPFLVGPFAYA